MSYEDALADLKAEFGRKTLLTPEDIAPYIDKSPAAQAALRTRNWSALFITHRSLWADARLVITGHALLEKLATAPRKPLTAHVLLDDPLSLSADQWAAKPFCPLPVLGLPGWWSGNDDPAFYDDETVFRPGRASAGR